MKVIYLSPLHLEWGEKNPLDSDDVGTLLREYRIVVRDGKDSHTIVVPAGFVFGPSIPKIARSFVSVSDCLAASCVHDWIYRTGDHTREFGDNLFRQMVEDRAGSWRARRAWVGVHFFGESSYLSPEWGEWRLENGF